MKFKCKQLLKVNSQHTLEFLVLLLKAIREKLLQSILQFLRSNTGTILTEETVSCILFKVFFLGGGGVDV